MEDHIIQLIVQYKYPVIIVTAIVEGPVLAIVAGFLMKLGQLSFWPAYITLMAADLIGDAGWYMVGYYGGDPLVRKFGKYFNVTEKDSDLVKRLFQKYQNKILFFSKLVMGLGFPFLVLTTAGMSKIKFKRYILINLSGQFIYTGVLISIGYLFGNAYNLIGGIMAKVTAVWFFVIIFVLLTQFRKYLRKKTAQADTVKGPVK